MQPPPPTTSPPDAAQGLSLPLAAIPVTPCHPPRPPINALLKHPSMETGTGANKHPLEQPVQQDPPQKHVRPKAFPYAQAPSVEKSMPATSAVDTPSRVLHVRKVLHQSTCQHLLRLHRCLLVLQQRTKSSM